MVEGLPLDLDTLKDRNERITWDQYRQVMANLSHIYSASDYFALGQAFVRHPLIRPLRLVAPILFDLRGTYRRITTPSSGSGYQMFACVHSTYRELSPQLIEVELRMAPGYEACMPFYQITHGAMSALPFVFSLPPAQVELELVNTGALFRIHLPPENSLLARLRRALLALFHARGLAGELEEANVLAVRRYHELEAAKQLIVQQARALETAHHISQRVHATFDLERALHVITEALVQLGGFRYARVELEGDPRSAEHDSRNAPSSEPLVQRALEGRGGLLGQLFVLPRPQQQEGELDQLLGYVVPVVSIALEEATAYAELEAYRDQLEEKVALRTEELQEARDRLAQTVAELTAAQAARDRFFANINHEIRTPLTLIALAVRRLEASEAAQSPEVKSLLKGVDSNVGRLLSLIEGLLLLAASRESKLRLEKKEVDLVELIERMLEGFRPRAEQYSLQLRSELPASLRAFVDEIAVERILANLLSNALKFTPAGGSVTVRLEAEGEDFCLSVLDTGIGLDPDFRRRVFGRFEQGRAPPRPGERGSGIGLAIVQELARAHGGESAYAENPGGGSIFLIRIPIRSTLASDHDELGTRVVRRRTWPPDETLPERSRDLPTMLEPEHGSAVTILVAEDEPRLLEEISRTLARRYRVLAASDGLAALELAKQHQPHALVTDVSMPGLTGFELARAFRELRGDQLAPILFVTAHGNLGQRLEGFESGGVDYVLKPFHPDELMARVSAQVEQRNRALRMEESERLAALGHLTAALAHEFRNPANGVINALVPLKRMLPSGSLEPGTPTAALLGVIESGAAQLQSLSEQVMSLVTGQEFRQPYAQSLAEIFDRAIEILGPALDGIEIRRDRSQEPEIEAAPFALVQAFINLLENAAHAIAGPGWIELRVRATEEGLVIRVADSGPGVPLALRARVFEPFFTTKDPGKGTGLGLPAVRRVVEQHGGALRLVEHAAGTAFEIVLPAHHIISRSPTSTTTGPASSSVQSER